MTMRSDKNYSTYSSETMKVIEDYMNATNLTLLQKKKILNELKKGKSVPMLLLENDTSIISYNHRQPVFCLKRNNKRKRETIVDSGAYDVPKFIPTKNLVDREKEKERLQNICWGIDGISEDFEEKKHIQNKRVSNLQEISDYERMEELMNEVEERIEFLNQMEKFGLKRKYQHEISNEISQKLRQLENYSNRIHKIRAKTQMKETDKNNIQ